MPALLCASLLGACTVTGDTPNLAGQDVRLTIIHTADTHSRLFPYEFAPGEIDKGLGLLPSKGDIAVVGGIARMAAVVYRERAASQRVLHLDSGDIFEGAPVFNTFAGEPEMRAMSKMGLNAMALGNHEFDKGAVNFELMKENFGGFPILAANYIFADPKDPTQPKLRDVIAPFSIFNVQGLKVAVIGMGNLSSLEGIYDGGNSLGISPLDTTQAVTAAVNLVRSQVDVVILLSHLGLDEDEDDAQQDEGDMDVTNQNPKVPGVDVTLGGHLHIVLNPPVDIPFYDEHNKLTSHTILCHSGAFAKYVGRLDLSVHVADPKVDGDKPNVKSYVYKIIPIDDSIQEDPDMANMLEPYQLYMNTHLNLTHDYAVIPCPPTSATCPKVVRADPNGGDSQLGNLVAASMRLRPRVEADFGLTNSLGIRADFESGPLNLEEMYNVFPFDNTITTIFLSGNEIQEMFNFVASRSADRGCKTQAQVSGIWYVGDCNSRLACGPFDTNGNPALHCTGDRSIDGPLLIGDNCLLNKAQCIPVLPAGEYRAAVNDYIASGGSGFAVLKRNTTKFNTGISLRDALLDYIIEQPNRCSLSDFPTIDDVNPMGASLPCVDSTLQAHDGRITMMGGS